MSDFGPVQIWIDGDPVPQGRIRFHIRGRGRRMQVTPYVPEKTREYQDDIRKLVQELMAENDIDEFPKGMPLWLRATFYLRRPKSTKRQHPTVRPDLSNYLKSLEDGLQRSVKDSAPALLEDDSSICKITCSKQYCDDEHPEPGVLILVGPMEEA